MMEKEHKKHEKDKDNEDSIFPMPLRCLIVEKIKSDSGKTILLWIITNYWTPSENLYFYEIYYPTSIYEKLQDVFMV